MTYKKTLIAELERRLKNATNAVDMHYKEYGHCDYHDTTDYGEQESLMTEQNIYDQVLSLVKDLK